MSKYQKLWEFLQNEDSSEVVLSFVDINNILGFSIDHSFLNYKQELINYGYYVKKISLKTQSVIFKKIV